MHERRNTILTVLFAFALVWGVFSWVCVAAFASLEHLPPSTDFHRYASLSSVFLLAASLAYVHLLEDKMPDRLAHIGSGRYYEQDGLCFMPVFRVTSTRPMSSSSSLSGGSRVGGCVDTSQQAELSLYYQNRYEGECEAVIHIRPPAGVFFSHKGARDVHFAFRCQPGAFGVIHQPVAVTHEAQGTPVRVEIAAMVRWVRHRGDQLRSKRGLPVGTFQVDWALAYRQSKHELSGEIELKNPAALSMMLPDCVAERIERSESVNETLMVKA
ncbi:MAG: hypothetical protein KF902_13445 [Phycisphaeraceae bacterium]|nr:hypothetical protein [Phycisphaeraceae bacterium]MCW5769236.1 hypothetical protein [Phycisphaeraceae bacterium]